MGPRERALRQGVSTFILLVFTLLGSAIISVRASAPRHGTRGDASSSHPCASLLTTMPRVRARGQAATFLKPNVEALVSDGCASRLNASLHPLAPPPMPPSSPAPLGSAGCISAAEIESIAECELSLFHALPILIGSTFFIILGHIIIFILAPVCTGHVQSQPRARAHGKRHVRKGSWGPQGYACCACTCTGYTWSMHGLCMCTRVCARAHARAPQVLSVLLERPHFFYQREMTVFLKLTFFQVFNVLFCMVTMLYRDGIDGFVAAGDQTTRGWLANAAPLLVNVLLGDMVVINIGIDCGRPDVFIMRNFIAPRCKTQSKMNRAYIVDADVYLAFRLQLVAKVTLGACASTRPRACVWGVWACTHACMRAPSRDLP